MLLPLDCADVLPPLDDGDMLPQPASKANVIVAMKVFMAYPVRQ
jgi:hypothetical protein